MNSTDISPGIQCLAIQFFTLYGIVYLNYVTFYALNGYSTVGNRVQVHVFVKSSDWIGTVGNHDRGAVTEQLEERVVCTVV